MADERYQKPFVQMKRRWSDQWETELELEADGWDTCLAPSRPNARISYVYGPVSPGTGARENLEPVLRARNGWYVRIVRQVTTAEWQAQPLVVPKPVPVFYGVLVSGKDAQGDERVAQPTGDEAGKCLGLDHLLERTQISTSVFWDGSATARINTSLPFNIRDAKTGTLRGNRSTDRHDGPDGRGDSYQFSDTDGATGSARDIVEYLVFQHGPADLGMTLALTEGLVNLGQYVEAWKPFPNIRAGLTALANRTRGHSWHITVWSVIDDAPQVQIVATFAKNVIGGGIVLTGNTDTVSLDGSDSRVVGAIDISDDIQPQFDVIEVVGDPLIIMDTLDFSGADPKELAIGWSAALETRYKEASDTGRAEAALESVYRVYKVNGSQLVAGPSVQDDGSLTTAITPTQSYLGKKLLRVLPMLKTDDDSSGPAEFRKPLVYALMPDAATYCDLSQARHVDKTMGNFNYRMLDGEMGFRLVGGAIAHVLALNHWGGDPEATEIYPKIDYETIAATVAWASTESLRVTVRIPRDNHAGVPRTLSISVPGAQAWWRAENVTTDIVDGVRQVESYSEELRNDRARLQAIATMAQAWYEVPRRTANIQLAGITDDCKVGQILERIESRQGAQAVNTVVSRVSFDAVRGTTLIQTDFQEINFVTFSGQGNGMAGIRQAGLSFPAGAAIGATNVGEEPDNLPAQDQGGGHQVIVSRGKPTGAFTSGTTITLNPVAKDGTDIPGMANVVCHLAADKSSVTASFATSDILSYALYEGNDGAADGVLVGTIVGATGDAVLTGSIMAYGGDYNDPDVTVGTEKGWLFCGGDAISRTTYAALFAKLSTKYGVGDGSLTFNLPDTRNKTWRGANAGEARDNATTRGYAWHGETENNHGDHVLRHTHLMTTGGTDLAAGTDYGDTTGNPQWDGVESGINERPTSDTSDLASHNGPENTNADTDNWPPHWIGPCIIKT